MLGILSRYSVKRSTYTILAKTRKLESLSTAFSTSLPLLFTYAFFCRIAAAVAVAVAALVY